MFNEMYGSASFGDAAMRERLPKAVYKQLKEVQAGEAELTMEIAEIVAASMKEWAIAQGATHYTHWFQPMTGLTAEKHDSFISPTNDGRANLEFSGKELIRGEPDASSFPSGGLRATFEARGYTVWDVTSPAFINVEDNGCKTLVIPTAFISYNGEALDKKTPLLRSMQAINKQAMRVLKGLGNETAKRVITTVGPEQEYFLVDADYFHAREDLVLTGRTLFGAMPPKGQEMEDHYFGTISAKASAFMADLNDELWKLGISAKTQHNEVAPNQFELAPIFSVSNVACDHNQLIMQTMKKVAIRHGLVCLLHEKPFRGVNGSGKHNNWSIGTDDGMNLLDPGSTPHENLQFMVFVSAVLAAVDRYAPLLRLSAANTGNDHRLGANEAPPAIISVFLGEQLEEIFEAVSNGKGSSAKKGIDLELGVTSLPKLPKDLTDRNRTSPFAFTGNKFEFRMVPSSDSIAGPNFVLNTVVAEVLSEFADVLEKGGDVKTLSKSLISDVWKKHKRIVFNGNGYTEDWVAEAKRRGLPNLTSSVEAWPYFGSDESVALFGKHNVLAAHEIHARLDIVLEKYSKQINIEAGVALEMAGRQLLPAAMGYASRLAGDIDALEGKKLPVKAMKERLGTIATLIEESYVRLDALAAAKAKAKDISIALEQAKAYRDSVFTAMEALRESVDRLEKLIPRDDWPIPGYEELLFEL